MYKARKGLKEVSAQQAQPALKVRKVHRVVLVLPEQQVLLARRVLKEVKVVNQQQGFRERKEHKVL